MALAMGRRIQCGVCLGAGCQNCGGLGFVDLGPEGVTALEERRAWDQYAASRGESFADELLAERRMRFGTSDQALMSPDDVAEKIAKWMEVDRREGARLVAAIRRGEWRGGAK